MKRRNEIDAQSNSFPPNFPRSLLEDAASLGLAMQYNRGEWHEKQVLALDKYLNIPFSRSIL